MRSLEREKIKDLLRKRSLTSEEMSEVLNMVFGETNLKYSLKKELYNNSVENIYIYIYIFIIEEVCILSITDYSITYNVDSNIMIPLDINYSFKSFIKFLQRYLRSILRYAYGYLENGIATDRYKSIESVEVGINNAEILHEIYEKYYDYCEEE